MKPHTRVILFCVVILLAPGLYSLGELLAGVRGAFLLPATAMVVSFVYAWFGRRGEPPVGARPS